MAFKFSHFLSGLNLVPKSVSTVSQMGDLDVTEGNGKLNYFNGSGASPLVTESGTATLTNKTINGNNNTLINISASSLPADIVYLDAVQTLTNKTINASVNSISNISNLNISTSANIARSKIASGTANQVVINAGDGSLSSEAQLALSRGGTSVSASSLPNLFNQLDPLTTKGDLITNDGTDSVRLAVGTDGMVLTADSGQTSGIKWGTSFIDPMTTRGDMVYRNSSNVTARLPVGSASQLVGSNGTDVAWAYPGYNVTSKTSVYSAIVNDFVNCTSGSFAVTLPTAVGNAGKLVGIGMAGATLVTVSTTSSQTIGGIPSGVISLGTVKDSLIVVSDGTNWQIIEMNINNSAQANLTNTTTGISSSIIVFNTEVSDPLNQYNSTNGIFTVNVPGTYLVNAAAVFGSLDGSTDASLFLRINGVNTQQFYASRLCSNTAAGGTARVNTIVTLTNSDTVAIWAAGDASFDLDSNGSRTFFSITRTGN